MRHQPIDKQLFIDNRAKFVAQMQPNAIAVFVSNDVMPRNADAHYKFRQNSEMYWLTGIAQEETYLILYPDAPLPEHREMLFVRQTSDTIAVWEGHKLTIDEARHQTGIQNVKWHNSFESNLHTLMKFAENCYLNLNENDRASTHAANAELIFAHKLQQNFPLHRYHRSAVILRQLRAVRHPLELEMTRKAIDITHQGLQNILKIIRPNIMEYAIEAELSRTFIANGANGFSFDPIIASGKNACILHYTDNDQAANNGDLILMDFGADYGYYAADMTRCAPVNGIFTPRQRQVYNAVLNVMRQATQLLTTQHTLHEYNTQAAKIMETELLSLGLITQDDINKQDPENPAYKKYFMHGTGHFLGIDVHDIGARYQKLQVGNIITCEPGIYIPAEGIGIRIENDILITQNTPIDLMSHIPIETQHIEDLMNA
jgi:Xaa-Pro aminopeptidase